VITTNVLHRTFHIRYGSSAGTAFTIDQNSRQYLITARHVVEGIGSGDSVNLFHENQWKNVSIRLVGLGAEGTDIAVLSTSIQLSPSYPLKSSQAGLVYGQQLFFLGFPFGWYGGGEYINRGFAMPFVRSGILSAIMHDGASSHTGTIYLDAFGNKGFSGGPVVFRPNAGRTNVNGAMSVAGVVVRYPPAPSHLLQPIVDKNRETIRDSQGEPVAYVEENPSLVVAVGIGHAIEVIKANPIGCELSAD